MATASLLLSPLQLTPHRVGANTASLSVRPGALGFNSLPVRGKTLNSFAGIEYPSVTLIRAPCAGRTPRLGCSMAEYQLQLTPPCGGRTGRDRRPGAGGKDFNSRPPVWGGLFICTYASKRQKATTHAPCAGTNKGVRSICCTRVSFNSRPHAGANDSHQVHTNPIGNFNSRPPCGGEQENARMKIPRYGLQLTPPCWGEPYQMRHKPGTFCTSTHAPCGGRTFT